MYSRPVLGLKRYLLDRPMDAYDNTFWIVQWLESNPDVADDHQVDTDKLQAMLNDSNYDGVHEILEKVVGRLTPDQRQEIADYINRHDSSEAPTWSHMDYSRMVKPNTWLIHFSDEAHAISYKGFTRGVDDLTKLGLTTYLGKDMKDYGGYNFAFRADGRHANWAAHKNKYGEAAVMFRASGVEAYHYGDEEDQVIFYGSSVDPGQVVLLTRDEGDWCVNMEGARSDRECAFRGDFSNAVQWVMRNFDQYRKRITNSMQKWKRPTWVA